MSQIIVFAFPFFLAAICLEYWWDWRQRKSGAIARSTYSFSDTLNSLSLGLLSLVIGVLTKFIGIAAYAWVFERIALFPQADLWSQWYGWLSALLLYDLCYYWLHRAGHEVAVFWAAHVVHHQSQEYNLSTALRQSSSGALLGWLFYLPLALLGVPPLLFGIVALIDLLYQFWVHTEHVGKLGWFDRVFCSPSNHRVHHAVNDIYVDRNYGGILVLWDRLFGTFQEENEPCVYGTRSPLNSWDPIWANVVVYADLFASAWRTPRWRDKLVLWFRPPGWQPEGVAPKTAFDIRQVQRFESPVSRAQRHFALLQYIVLMLASSIFLWFADAMPWQNAALYGGAMCATAWAIGCYLQGRLRALEVLAVQAACVAILGALNLLPYGAFSKPLVMVLMIIQVLLYGKQVLAMQARSDHGVLALALCFSLAGDVFLLDDTRFFIAGLASFLVTHVLYIWLMARSHGWLPQRQWVWPVLLVGLLMYALLWPHLSEPGLALAVALYMLVISLMAAQALGRAAVAGQTVGVAADKLLASNAQRARRVAWGACIFMLSDSLIAISRFLVPLPDTALWVLSCYYLAQMLIVCNLLEVPAPLITNDEAKP